jgi:hypothetical protein
MLQDESWQQNVSMDLYAATAHIQYLTNVVHRLCTQLADRGIVTPLGASEEFRPYEAPEREMPWLSKDAGDDEGVKRKRKKRGGSYPASHLREDVHLPPERYTQEVDGYQPLGMEGDQSSLAFSEHMASVPLGDHTSAEEVTVSCPCAVTNVTSPSETTLLSRTLRLLIILRPSGPSNARCSIEVMRPTIPSLTLSTTQYHPVRRQRPSYLRRITMFRRKSRVDYHRHYSLRLPLHLIVICMRCHRPHRVLLPFNPRQALLALSQLYDVFTQTYLSRLLSARRQRSKPISWAAMIPGRTS